MATSRDDWSGHRLYTADVIRVSDDVTFVCVLPPVDRVCRLNDQLGERHSATVADTGDVIDRRHGYTYLPVQVFEHGQLSLAS